MQRRIDELTREKWNERREKEAALALVERLKSKEGDPKPDPVQDLDSLVAQKLAERDFNEACNKTYAKGKEQFQDFDEAVNGHKLLGDIGGRRDYLEAVSALDNGAQVFHHLGKNLDEAAHVLSLPPVKMALELTKLSQKLSKAPPVSKAPPPIKPVAGTASRDFDPETASMDEWVKWRDEQVAKERGR